MSWEPTVALETSWRTFTTQWQAFCYPGTDDVTISPLDERWVLCYHHWEAFSFTARAERTERLTTRGGSGGYRNGCARRMPAPSRTTTSWPAFTPAIRSVLPFGQRMLRSAAVAAPRPKCRRRSLTE